MATPTSALYSPTQLAGLNPGANTSGSTLGPMRTGNVMPFGSSTSLGNTSSPFAPAPVTGTSMPAYSSPYAPSGATAALAGLGATGAGVNQPGGPNTNIGSGQFGYTGSDLAKSFQQAGTMPGGLGTAAAAFMNSGAGFNPQVAQALIAAMQPQIAKGEANLMEQYGGTGTAASSAGQLGLADYLAQTNLDVGQLLSGLYEQSVSNYMDVLGMGHINVSEQKQQGGGVLGGIGSLMSGLGSLIPGIGPAVAGIGALLKGSSGGGGSSSGAAMDTSQE